MPDPTARPVSAPPIPQPSTSASASASAPQSQSSQTYHARPSSRHPFLPPTRPSITNPSSPSSPPRSSPSSTAQKPSGISLAERARAMSVSAVSGSGSGISGSSSNSGLSNATSDLARFQSLDERVAESNGQAGQVDAVRRTKERDIFDWFQGTVIISMVVRNWPS